MKKEILEKWDNTCIKVLSEEHGKQVIKFWESVGINTIGWNGNQVYYFYGLFDGRFNNWYDEGHLENKRILTLEEAIAIRDEEKWQPKFGELVNAYDSESDCYYSPHIFLFEKNGVYHCVSESKNDIKEFNSSEIRNEYRVFKFRYVKQIETPKPIEISLEEAKEIIAKEKGIKAEQVNLNFKIN